MSKVYQERLLLKRERESHVGDMWKQILNMKCSIPTSPFTISITDSKREMGSWGEGHDNLLMIHGLDKPHD